MALRATRSCLKEGPQVVTSEVPRLRSSCLCMIEDAMIAATATVHNLIVVTRNVRDFKDLGVQTLNTFKYET
jgi:predicted nucleic acid-binding protein